MFRLNREPLPLIISLVLAAVSVGLYLGTLWVTWGPILRSQPLGAAKIQQPVALDFALHWTASHLALAGEADKVYDYAQLRAREQELTGYGPHPWPYPPTALLLDYPLALAPYFLSLALWSAMTLALYLLVLYRIAPRPLTIFWALAFVGTFANLAFGQNGFISAALLGGGLVLLESSPLTAGILLGLLSYKPHLAVLTPLALLVGRQWRALGGAIASSALLILGSIAVFGPDIWIICLKTIPGTLANLNTEAKWFSKMPSVYATLRLAGLASPTAWFFQGAAMLLAGALVVRFWTAPTSLPVKSAALVVATLLFSPHIWYYDLPLLALPLAWFWWEGSTKGWLPGEEILLILSWIIPALSFILSAYMYPQGPLYLVPAIILLLRRYFLEQRKGRHPEQVTLELSG